MNNITVEDNKGNVLLTATGGIPILGNKLEEKDIIL